MNWFPLKSASSPPSLGPGYDIILVIGDSNNHHGPSYDPLIDITHPQMYQLRQNNTTYEIAEEPDIDHEDNAFALNKIGYCTTFTRDYYIPNHLEEDRIALIIPRAWGGTGVSIAGARMWTSIVKTCSLTNGSPNFTHAATPALTTHPNPALNMYAIAGGLPEGTRLTTVTSTTGVLSENFTGVTGDYQVRFRGSGIQYAIDGLEAAMSQSGTNRVVAILYSNGTNDISGEGSYSTRVAEGIADLRASGAGLSEDVPVVINGIVPAVADAPTLNSAFIQADNEAIHTYVPNSAYASPYANIYPAPHDTELFSDGENAGKHYNAAGMRDYGGRYYITWSTLV